MKFAFIFVTAGVLLAGPAGAVNCMNGIPPSNPDSVYTVHGDGTVTDTRTGLMWKVCPEGRPWSADACATSGGYRYTWEQAMSIAETSSYAGHDDWRLPNIKELLSLAEECRVSPSINDDIFPGGWIQALDFWSNSPTTDSGGGSMWVAFSGSGALGMPTGAGSLIGLSVRLVRNAE